jgi:hypothetical protein
MSISEQVDALYDQYGGYELIPNDALYSCLQDGRQDLANMAKLGSDHIPNSKLGREVRRRSEADLLWLARYFTWETNAHSEKGTKPLSENLITEEYYQTVCDLFVKKDKSKPLNQQSTVKTRLLLWPRSGFKSTIDHVDTVQWILNFPSIRILYLTAEVSLSKGFVDEVKGHFQRSEDEPTLMELFFPEFCFVDVASEEDENGVKVKGQREKMEVFTCPVWKAKKIRRKEPTVVGSSVGKTKSGWHYELIKMDDAVSDVNTESSEQCSSISHKLFLAEKLIIPGGYYVDYIGTRYADEDHYGELLEKNENFGEVERREGPGWFFVHNKTTNMNILVGRAITIKPEIVERLQSEGRKVTYQEAGEAGCILLLPHIMSFSWLMNDLAKDEKSFEGQRNQNPRSAGSVTFDRPLLLRCTIPYQMLPRSGPVSNMWDFNGGKQKKGLDYTTGSAVMWSEADEIGPNGKPVEIIMPNGTKTRRKKTVGSTLKVVRDRFNNLTGPQAVIRLAQETRPFIIGIEDSPGVRYMEYTILTEAAKTGDPYIMELCAHIEWIPVDNQNDAKKLRIGQLYPWMVNGQWFFLNACMDPLRIEILYTEFEKCQTSHHHEDIPDCLAYQLRYAPRATQAIVENNTDMFFSIDRQGWGEVFDENYRPNSRGGYYLGDDGQMVPIQQTGPTRWTYAADGTLVPIDGPTPEPTDFFSSSSEPETSGVPSGMNNILGAGMWG